MIHKYGFDISNIKNLTIHGNYIGIPTQLPSMIVEYDKKIDPNCNDGSDLSENDINATITFNTFAMMNPEMVEIRDADDDFSSDLIPDQFKIENNALLQPCLCWTDADIDEAFDEEDDEDDDTVLFAKKVLNSMLCFTNHMPPVLGEWKFSCPELFNSGK